MYIAVALSEDETLNISGIVLNCEIHQKVFIYVYLQFKSEFKENYLALTSLKHPLTILGALMRRVADWIVGGIYSTDKQTTPGIKLTLFETQLVGCKMDENTWLWAVWCSDGNSNSRDLDPGYLGTA